jgi:signal peptidase I/conjugal transfer pilin signal peptidase TrbI
VTTRKKILGGSLVMLLIAAMVGGLLPGRVSVTLSPSVKHRVWWLDPDLSRIHRGDYVLFAFPLERYRGARFPESVRSGDVLHAIKRVGCDEGETVIRKDRDFYCGEEFLGQARERSNEGELLIPAEVAGAVLPGKVFLVGDHPDSFDSRYYGLIDKSSFRFRAVGIF